MKLAFWQYAGPAHIGTLRVATSLQNVYAVMHGPLGDDYFNVMRSMLERERDFTPVTTSIVDKHVLAKGSEDKVYQTLVRKNDHQKPDLLVLTPTCTSSILQEALTHFVEQAAEVTKTPTLLAEVNHYRVNELQAADKTLEQIVHFVLQDDIPKDVAEYRSEHQTPKPSVNIIGVFTLGFHNNHDCRELRRLFQELDIEVNVILPEGSTIDSIKQLPKAWFNIVPYREVGLMTAKFLEKRFGVPFVSTTPLGLLETKKFLHEIAAICTRVAQQRDEKNSINNHVTEVGHLNNNEKNHLQYPWNPHAIDQYATIQSKYISQAAWFSRSIDCQNLTGKRAIVFGDATHAVGITRVLAREMGIQVVCAGTYCKNDSEWFREQTQPFCEEILITDDHAQVREMITRINPAAIFGTQMERHIGKQLGIPCGVISAPVHIQNFSLGYRPFLGYEGTNNISDLVYNTFTLGMEDHLLEIFGGHDTTSLAEEETTQGTQHSKAQKQYPSFTSSMEWDSEALEMLHKIPRAFIGPAQKLTEHFARKHNIKCITIDVMNSAKENGGF